MKIYDEQIASVLNLLSAYESQCLSVNEKKWTDVGKQNLVLRSEMAYELGAGTLPAVSFLGVTSSSALFSGDGAYLFGKDLDQIEADTPYARITLLQVEDEDMGKGEAIYDAMRRFIYTRYKVNPKGFMSRISTSSNHEPVRVGRVELAEGLRFSSVAQLFLEAYKAHREIVSVQVIFVTLADFDYGELMRLAQKNDAITAALDHILRDLKMDCSSCKLQAICNEVDGMKEMHFR